MNEALSSHTGSRAHVHVTNLQNAVSLLILMNLNVAVAPKNCARNLITLHNLPKFA